MKFVIFSNTLFTPSVTERERTSWRRGWGGGEGELRILKAFNGICEDFIYK